MRGGLIVYLCLLIKAAGYDKPTKPTKPTTQEPTERTNHVSTPPRPSCESIDFPLLIRVRAFVSFLPNDFDEGRFPFFPGQYSTIAFRRSVARGSVPMLCFGNSTTRPSSSRSNSPAAKASNSAAV